MVWHKGKNLFLILNDESDRLGEREKQSWSNYRWQKHQLKRQAWGLVNDLAEKKSVRVVKRSAEE